MIACSQRAQRNATGYFTGYIQKRQPVGKFELAQAAQNLQYLSKSISGRSNKEQFHRLANRMLGDLEFRGQARTATEEFNISTTLSVYAHPCPRTVAAQRCYSVRDKKI